MGEYSEAFVAFDVAKRKHAVPSLKVAGRARFGFSVRSRTARRRLSGCSSGWQAGMVAACLLRSAPTGYELYRHIRDP
jgi:transposase